jgi:hypothetical protein
MTPRRGLAAPAVTLQHYDRFEEMPSNGVRKLLTDLDQPCRGPSQRPALSRRAVERSPKGLCSESVRSRRRDLGKSTHGGVLRPCELGSTAAGSAYRPGKAVWPSARATLMMVRAIPTRPAACRLNLGARQPERDPSGQLNAPRQRLRRTAASGVRRARPGFGDPTRSGLGRRPRAAIRGSAFAGPVRKYRGSGRAVPEERRWRTLVGRHRGSPSVPECGRGGPNGGEPFPSLAGAAREASTLEAGVRDARQSSTR